MIRNATTGKIISHQERICKTPLSWTHGLMFRRRQNLVMVFPQERQISLHMMFVFYPIEVLIVDKNFQVIALKKLYPFQWWISKSNGKYLVELGLPESQGKAQKGDIITIC